MSRRSSLRASSPRDQLILAAYEGRLNLDDPEVVQAISETPNCSMELLKQCLKVRKSTRSKRRGGVSIPLGGAVPRGGRFIRIKRR